ncbi:helix-turn-helix domain-containing protein, partial [Klebsiella pneumoniae]
MAKLIGAGGGLHAARARHQQRLNLSQPSVSIQLARLREIFADPL